MNDENGPTGNAFAVTETREEKVIPAVASKRGPWRGFSLMCGRPNGLKEEHEDQDGVHGAADDDH